MIYHDLPVKQLREWYYNRMHELFAAAAKMPKDTYEQRVACMNAGVEAQYKLDSEYRAKLQALIDIVFAIDDKRKI